MAERPDGITINVESQLVGLGVCHGGHHDALHADRCATPEKFVCAIPADERNLRKCERWKMQGSSSPPWAFSGMGTGGKTETGRDRQAEKDC